MTALQYQNGPESRKLPPSVAHRRLSSSRQPSNMAHRGDPARQAPRLQVPCAASHLQARDSRILVRIGHADEADSRLYRGSGFAFDKVQKRCQRVEEGNPKTVGRLTRYSAWLTTILQYRRARWSRSRGKWHDRCRSGARSHIDTFGHDARGSC